MYSLILVRFDKFPLSFIVEDLTSLRSIAAILGGVSFGIFIFLLLCSVVYKRYINTSDRRSAHPPNTSGDSDYLDAVQAAAPPSYHTGMMFLSSIADFLHLISRLYKLQIDVLHRSPTHTTHVYVFVQRLRSEY